VFGLIGRNGAGKSTTLRAIVGLNSAVGARILFRERPVRDNLVIGAKPGRLGKEFIRARIDAAYALSRFSGNFGTEERHC
jgi:ABC-type oligopeptide transport system ATPase subunit